MWRTTTTHVACILGDKQKFGGTAATFIKHLSRLYGPYMTLIHHMCGIDAIREWFAWRTFQLHNTQMTFIWCIFFNFMTVELSLIFETLLRKWNVGSRHFSRDKSWPLNLYGKVFEDQKWQQHMVQFWVHLGLLIEIWWVQLSETSAPTTEDH